MKGKIKIGMMAFFVFAIFLFLLLFGYSYYTTSLDQRFFHENYNLLKSSGLIGHGLGIIGSLFILIGLFSYMARKRLKIFSRLGLLKNWLHFHIFLCSLGSVMILFHTTFKFDGIIAFGFWSLAVVVLSGIVGRFIYVQIPRSIEGNELSLQELHQIQDNIGAELREKYTIDEELFNKVRDYNLLPEDNNLFHWFRGFIEDFSFLKKLKKESSLQQLSKREYKKTYRLIRQDIVLNHKIKRLSTLHNLFRNWHVIHLPFALIMLVIMVIHVVVVVLFGYKWIF